MLQLTKREPVWHDRMPGVRVLFAPIDQRAWRAAKRAAAAELQGDEEDMTERAGDAFSRALIAGGIRDWEGIGDTEGNPIAPTAETIGLFLDDPRNFDWADEVYVMPFAAEHAEGNVSGASPNGISAGAMPATNTASSAAAAESGATGAPTPGTRSKPKRGATPGK